MFKVLGPHTTTVMGEALLLSLGVRTTWLYRESSITSEGEGDSERHLWLKGLCSHTGMRRTDFFLLHFAAKQQKKQTQVGVSRSFTFSSSKPEGEPSSARLQKSGHGRSRVINNSRETWGLSLLLSLLRSDFRKSHPSIALG